MATKTNLTKNVGLFINTGITLEKTDDLFTDLLQPIRANSPFFDQDSAANPSIDFSTTILTMDQNLYTTRDSA